ncbi:MAG TPA: acetyl-CoA carboxylase biotin carboxyl carrier protein subunit, partial [Dongiaceae bacterium]|nr:acetyl-CoA carboxylase biotin carboxyl carrier protein subunit [Dongiaceae bacterium]
GTATLEPFAASLALRPAQGTTKPAGSNGVAPGDRANTAAASAHAAATPTAPPADDGTIRVEVNDRLFRVRFVDVPLPRGGAAVGSASSGAKPAAPKKGGSTRTSAAAAGNDVVSPMHGVVVEIPVAQGASVNEGAVVAVIEAMKMMNEIRAHKAGTVSKIHVEPGATVEARTPLITLA